MIKLAENYSKGSKKYNELPSVKEELIKRAKSEGKEWKVKKLLK